MMRDAMRNLILLPAALVLGIVGQANAAGMKCEELGKLSLPHTTITTAAVGEGSFTPPGGQELGNLPSYCRVTGSIKPSSDSDIQFEVWLPETGWNGKYQGIGNGGFAGNISHGGLAGAIRLGYAASSTDTGHRAGGTDATWALNHPEKVIDYGYRGIHLTAVTAKKIITSFYGTAPKRSYFSSCSNGGRQALMEAQRYPEDYDGIIAGAPANHWTHLLTGALWSVKATLVEPGTYIQPSKLPAIQSAANNACDATDGVTDGVMENPATCRFDPSPLLCTGTESDDCLTALQVTALKKIYGGPVNAKGKSVYPGYSPGGEAEPGGWGPWITGQAPEKALMFAFGTQFFRNIVYSDPAWDYHGFEVDRDLKAAIQKSAKMLNAVDPDLSGLQKRGGKLILYHGWNDAAIPALSTIDYYNSVVKKMGASQTAKFVRLFMVPGMQHCGGGAGTDSFGQGGPATGNPDSNIGAALERWVEDDAAPERIVATKFTKGPQSAVVRTRPLCAYPMVARYKGSGSTDDAANFECAKPDTGTK